jgi:small subunit ribosomal protein S20
MPNIPSAKKRMRAEAKRRLHNNQAKSIVRTRVTRARNAITASASAPETDEAIRAAIRALDMAVSRGVIHRNNAARRKSRLMARLHTAEGAQTAKASK